MLYLVTDGGVISGL